MYIRGIHRSMKTVRQDEVYMSFWTEEQGVGIWDFKGK